MKYSPPPAFLDLCQSDRSAETPFFNFLSTFTHRGQAHTDGMIINTNTITYRDRPQRTETRKKRAFPKGPPLCQAPSRQHPPPRTAAKGGALKRIKTFCGIFAPAGGTARERLMHRSPTLFIYTHPQPTSAPAGIISTPIEAIVCTVRTFFGPLWFKVKYFLYFCDVNDISYG